jgi:hypothetical protein
MGPALPPKVSLENLVKRFLVMGDEPAALSEAAPVLVPMW